MKEAYNLITPFLDELLKKGISQREINEAIEFIYEETGLINCNKIN